MLINSLSLMSAAFHRSQTVNPETGEMLTLLVKTLEVVKQEGRFLVEIPDEWVPGKWANAAKRDTEQAIVNAKDMKQVERYELSPNNLALFSLVDIGARELQRLWARQSQCAVRCIGYALHPLPGLLQTPEQFSPKSYRFCFRIISAHWSELSVEMREAFCGSVGLELQAAERLIKSAGFALVNFWVEDRSREITIVDDDDQWFEQSGHA